MRIIAGEFRGRQLKAPKGSGTRPTTDRVREALMSALASARGGLEGAVVLDAFAGSGALSFEALSRGAACSQLYERDRAALSALMENAKALRLPSSRARIHRADVFKTPPSFANPPFDLVFLDPPYAYVAGDVLGLVARLARGGVVADGAIVVYEHAAADSLSVDEAAQANGLALASRKKYGDTCVDLLRIACSGEGVAAGKASASDDAPEADEGDRKERSAE